jgi:hypothetical protein
MTAPQARQHAAAPATDRVLFQVVHLQNMDLDEWTQDYAQARVIFARFVRNYGGAHLHAAVLHAGHYEAECLQHCDGTAEREP